MSLRTLASFGAALLLVLTGALSSSHAQPLVDGAFLEVHAGIDAPPSGTQYQDPGLTKDYDLGWGVNVAAGLPLNERVDGALRVGISRFGGVALDRSYVPDGASAPVAVRVDGGALTVGSLRADLRAALREGGRFIPYLRVTPGLFLLARGALQRATAQETSSLRNVASEQTISVGIGAAAGLAVQVRPDTRLLIEPGVISSFTSVVPGARNEDMLWIPLRLGALVTL